MALADDLLAAYKLDEASGNAVEEVGGYSLTAVNSPGTRSGAIGNARNFVRGTGQSFARTSASLFNRGNASTTGRIAILIDSLAPGSEEEFVKLHNSSTFIPVWQITEDFGKFRLRIPGASDLISSEAPTTGVWHHVMWWRDSVSKEIGISVNGAEVTATYSGTIPTTSNPELVLNGNPGRELDGGLDEFLFWGRALSPAERAAIWNGGDWLGYDDIISGGSGGGSPLLHAMMQYSFTGGCL